MNLKRMYKKGRIHYVPIRCSTIKLTTYFALYKKEEAQKMNTKIKRISATN
nr:MAG TPA: hypothetical protein [Caudoviricetes sp.]